jgi:hypothetical protein
LDHQALPADSRLVIAQKSRSAAAAVQAAIELDWLVRLSRNVSLREEERRKAVAWVLRPATPTADRSCSRAVAEICGVAISPKIASEYSESNDCCRNSKRPMDRSDRGAFGKPTRLEHA